MRRLRWVSIVVVIAVVVAGLVIGSSRVRSDAPTRQGGLFLTAPEADAAAPPVPHRAAIRSRVARLDFGALGAAASRATLDTPAAEVTLNLFDDVTLTAAVDRVDQMENGYVWVGHVPGAELSNASFSVVDGVMAGSVVTTAAQYTIRPIGGSLHEVVQLDSSRMRPDGEPKIAPPATTASAVGAAAQPAADTPQGDGAGTIDVMVLYTSAAQTASGGASGIAAFVNLGISLTNTSYSNSGVTQRVRLAHAELVTYTETGDIGVDLDNVSNAATPLGATAAARRDTSHADIVTLLVQSTAPYCGVAWMQGGAFSAGWATTAFNVVEQECFTDNYSFGHEMGHNMGANHDWYVDNSLTPTSYGHGYVKPGSFRTVMAYASLCTALGQSCTRVPYWSNPAVTYPSTAFPMGIAAGTKSDCPTGSTTNYLCDADDHRTLNETAAIVANFRQSADAAPVVTSHPVARTIVAGATTTFTAAASGSPTPTVQWQLSTNGGTTYGNIANDSTYSGVTTGTLTITNATVNLSGARYRARFTNALGSASSNGASLTVTAPPKVTQNPSPQVVPNGGTATFTAAASGSPTPTVQWQLGPTPWNNIIGATSTTLTFTMTEDHSGNAYRAVFTNSSGTATTAAASVFLATVPTVTAHPASQSVALGGTGTFTAAGSGLPRPTVQWQISSNGGDTYTNLAASSVYSGVTTDTLTVTGVTAAFNNLRYRAVYTNTAGSTPTNAAVLTLPALPTITAHPADVTAAVGTTMTFTAAATSSTAMTVKWQRRDFVSPLFLTWADVPGAISTTLSVTVATTHEGDQFRAVFTNGGGSVNTNPATVTIGTAPAVTGQPSNKAVSLGQQVTFMARASGSPTPSAQWQYRTSALPLPNGTWASIGRATVTTNASLTFTPTLADNGKRYRVVFTNDLGTATSNAVVLSVTSITPTPAAIRLGATKNGESGALVAVTPPQDVMVIVSGATTGWTATANQTWLQITNGTGSGDGMFTVALVNPGNVLGGTEVTTATITLTPTLTGLTPVTIPVTLTVDQSGGAATTAPFGLVDTPAQSATGIQGTIGVTGWALDDVGVAYVRVYRNCLSFEAAANCATVAGRPGMVYVGEATITSGTRPDVEGAFPTHPQSYRGGWGYLLLTNLSPHIPNQQMFGGQGTIALNVLAIDVEGRQTWLGRTQADTTPTTMTMANDSIAKPFGAIDTPGQGELKNGIFPNFGWALSPDSNTGVDAGDILVPTAGTSIQVWVDGVARGNPEAFNLCRGTTPQPTYCNDDIGSIFGNPTPQPVYTTRTSNPTKFRNLDAGRGAIGYRHIDTTTLSNGLHTIEWSVYDSASRGEGIGSRYFMVLNAGTRPADESVAGAGLSEPRGDTSFVGAGFSQPQGDVRLKLDATKATPDATQVQPDLADQVSALRDAPAMIRGDAAPVEALPVAPATVSARTGFDLEAPLVDLAADDLGAYAVRAPALGRVELVVGPVDAGYLVANGTLRDLPIGSHLDPASGTFTWTPGVGYHGTYRLVFVGPGGRIPVAVTVWPIEAAAPGVAEIRMHLDTPQTGAAVGTSFVVAGWALDPQADIGAGIGRVHVWARRTDAPGTPPAFLGDATLGLGRPDVAQAHGAAGGHAGFSLAAGPLAPGTYDITAYVWNRRTARWEDARTAGGIVVK